MNGFVVHLISGDANFSGNLLLLASAVLLQSKNAVAHRSTIIISLLGMMLITLSSPPLGWLYYCSLGIALVALAATVRRIGVPVTELRDAPAADVSPDPSANHHSEKYGQTLLESLGIPRLRASAVLIAISVFGIAMESAARWPVSFPSRVPRHLTIFGDSVTAGMEENEAITWPNLVRDEHNVSIDDRSKMGATVGSQLRELDVTTIKSGVVLIELGGNDIFGATSATQFHKQLDEFLDRVSQTGQPVVMFELPLPPFYFRFGRSQRLLAEKYGIHLLHKRAFASVLAGNSATLDSIHLSQAGHHLMARKVWGSIKSGFEAKHDAAPD